MLFRSCILHYWECLFEQVVARALQRSFDSVATSRREAATLLRMTVFLLSPQPRHSDRGEPQKSNCREVYRKTGNSRSERQPSQGESVSH